MTRSITPAAVAASEADTIRPVLLVKLEFDSGAVCLHSWTGELDYGGDTYTGAGSLGSISAAEEPSELARSTVTLTLRGLPTDLVSTILNQHYQGRTATIRLGYFNDEMQLIADPVIVYRGRMDEPGIRQGETLEVSLSVESRFAAWDRPNIRRYNNADQQQRFPGDRGLEFVEQAVEKQIVWGR